MARFSLSPLSPTSESLTSSDRQQAESDRLPRHLVGDPLLHFVVGE